MVSDYRVLATPEFECSACDCGQTMGDEIPDATITREVDENSAAGTPVGGTYSRQQRRERRVDLQAEWRPALTSSLSTRMVRSRWARARTLDTEDCG